MKKELLEVSPEKRNEWFNSLPVHEQRRALAAEAIVLVGQNKIKPVNGFGYLRFRDYLTSENYDTEFQEYMDNENVKTTKCNVCQLGGLFASLCLLDNDTTPRTHYLKGIYTSLKPYFSYQQLRLMEVTFEDWDRDKVYTKECADFVKDCNTSRERFLKIMNSIVEHPKGLFIP